MTLQNRVLPTGKIVADPSKAGIFMGNRGILHNDHKQLGPARWKHLNWITCVLSFKGRRRELMAPGRYTELFFLDDAVALAAGHRPCAECRRADYTRYRAAFEAGNGPVEDAAGLDRILHRARVASPTRRQITHEAEAASLPDGTFIALDGESWLILADRLLRYSPGGYDAERDRPGRPVTVLTPAPSVAALAAGYCPRLHQSAGAPCATRRAVKTPTT